MPDIKTPMQHEGGDPPKAEAIQDWGSLNTKAARPAIQANQFSWVENFMPIGPGNLRTLYAEGATLYTTPNPRTIILHFPYNLGSTTYVAVFLDNGSAVQVRESDGAQTTIGGPGTFYSGGDLPACCQFESKYLLIGSTVSPNAYWVWDGSSLFGAGTLAPQVTLVNSGRNYTSAPTVTANGGSGSGATFLATVADGSVTDITVTNPGSGYLEGDLPQLTITGGGSDNQARAHAVISTTGGVTEVDVTNGGNSYTNDVHVTFSGGGGSGAQAVVSSAINGVIVSITVTNPGSGYTSPPTVAFTATGGSGATAVANITRGQITSIVVDSGGSGYNGAPNVVISAPDDDSFPTIQAVATATISAGAVTGFTISNSGAGYIHATVSLEGGNNAANATITLMPFGLQASAIETYNDGVWTSVGTKMTFSSPGSVAQFSTVSGGGSARATGSYLRDRIVALKQNSGFLYRLGDSSIDAISNVQTSSNAVTTFNTSNVDAQIGTAWRDSVIAFDRAVVFANPTGVYALYGGSAQKVSDALDGLFAKATFNAGGEGVTPTASEATIFGIRVYMLLFTTTDPYSNTKRNIVACWDGQKWFVCTQEKVLTFISPEEINSVLTAWGTDGTRLFKLVQTPSEGLTKAFQTKLDMGQGVHLYHQALRAYVVALNNASDEALLNISVDTEVGRGPVHTSNISQALSFTGSGPITWIGAGSVPLIFTVGSLQIDGWEISAYGRMMGWTLSTTADDTTIIQLERITQEGYALFG